MENNKNKGIICYDLVLIPKFMPIKEVFEICEKTNYLFYDSFGAPKQSVPPYMIDGSKMNKILIDVSTKEGKDIYNKIKDEDTLKC